MMDGRAILIGYDRRELQVPFPDASPPNIYTNVSSYKIVDDFICIKQKVMYSGKSDDRPVTSFVDRLIPKRYIQTLMVFSNENELNNWLDKHILDEDKS